jgi:hypothetical protein
MRQLLEKELVLEPWQRAPQWRWNIALASRASLDPVTPLKTDSSLYEAAGFYRHVCQQRNGFVYRKRVYPEMSMAFALWAGAHTRTPLDDQAGKSGWRGIIDALLLAGLPPDQFRTALRIDMPRDAIRLYHDMFFDVGSYLDSEPAVFINVLGASEQKLPEVSKLESNCMLRLFAYTWGPDATLEYFFSRNKGVNKMHQRWLKMLANEIITRQAVSIAMDRRNFYREDCREILDMARKTWEMPEDEVSSVEEEMRKKFLHETVTLLDNQLRKADVLRAEKELTRAQALAEVQI